MATVQLPGNNTPKLYDLNEVAKRTGYCREHLRRCCRARKIRHHKVLGRYYFTQEDIDALTVVREPKA